MGNQNASKADAQVDNEKNERARKRNNRFYGSVEARLSANTLSTRNGNAVYLKVASMGVFIRSSKLKTIIKDIERFKNPSKWSVLKDPAFETQEKFIFTVSKPNVTYVKTRDVDYGTLDLDEVNNLSDTKILGNTEAFKPVRELTMSEALLNSNMRMFFRNMEAYSTVHMSTCDINSSFKGFPFHYLRICSLVIEFLRFENKRAERTFLKTVSLLPELTDLKRTAFKKSSGKWKKFKIEAVIGKPECNLLKLLNFEFIRKVRVLYICNFVSKNETNFMLNSLKKSNSEITITETFEETYPFLTQNREIRQLALQTMKTRLD